ncbi:26S proteasome non ATPase regulatory subunit 7 [Trichuris trichiura]|uniref:26S proteasome non ATPase regulatory subunit 7 n=1 Tax=Trichuris trichiura TaxID=36087 RepID=A0A077ZK69_TRITR|nr:26S proteasome non ATPase regulatory subunit 7 [Trichuris trichiura]
MFSAAEDIGVDKTENQNPDVADEPKDDFPVSRVIVHPLVMLSVVDHFNRVYKATQATRVVGVLLGTVMPNRVVNVSNCFGLPFEEEDTSNGVWFIDLDYLENMYAMFRKVNARESIVGWYHSGPNLYKNDVEVNETLKKFIDTPVLIVVRAKPMEVGSPLTAYIEMEEVQEDGSTTKKTFALRPSKVESEEAEEIGVEHLLRDVKDRVSGTLAQSVTNRMVGLKGMVLLLEEITAYLKTVASGELPVNNSVCFHVQEVMNALPDLDATYWLQGFTSENNTMLMNLFLSSTARAVLGLHDLIENKLALRVAERDMDRQMRREALKRKDAAKSPKKKD